MYLIHLTAPGGRHAAPLQLRNALGFHLEGMKTFLEDFVEASQCVAIAPPRISAIATVSRYARRVQYSLVRELLFRRLNGDFG